MKICPTCGNTYEETQKFCSSCGSPLIPAPEAPPSPETPAEVPAEAPAEVPAEVRAEIADEILEAPDRTPPPPEPPETKKKSREKKEVGAGRRILAVLLCILLFFFLLTPALGYAVRRATTEEGLQAVMDDMDIADLKVAPFFDDVDDEELTLSEMLCEDLAAVGLKFGESSVAKILNSNALKGYLAKQLAGVFSDVYRGRTRNEFDPATLREELLEGKTAHVLDREKISLTGAEADKVVKLLSDYGMGDALSRDTLKDEAPGLLRAMNLGLSWWLIIGLLVLALVLIVLIFKVNRWRAGLSFGDVGGTALAVGLLLSLATLFTKVFPALWQKLCGGSEIAAAAGAGVLNHNLRISLIVFGAGLVLAVIGRLLRGRRAKEPVED